jgi:hypothetical protein
MAPLKGLSMPSIKLPQLPDRTPVKLTIALAPELHQALTDYAAFYEEIYGKAEPVGELVPAMLERFLEADRHFARSHGRPRG